MLRSSGDDSKAAHLRQPLLSRHCLVRDVYLSFPHQVECVTRKCWAELACLWDVVEERSQAGAFERNNALALFRAGLGEYRRAVAKRPTSRQGSSAQRLRAAMQSSYAKRLPAVSDGTILPCHLL